MRDRLIEILMKWFWEDDTGHIINYFTVNEAEHIANYLLANGVIVPPDELYSITDEGTRYATVSKAKIDWLPLYVIKNPEKYRFYRTREEAEQALKGSVQK